MRQLLSFLLIFTATCALGTDFYVNPDGSGAYPTIADAVDACSHGDRVLLNAGVFTGSGNRDVMIDGDIEIRAAGSPGTAIIDCQGAGRAFRVEYGDVTFRGLVVTGGHADGDGGAIHQEEGQVTLHDCVLRGNSATGDGGAVHVFEAGQLIIHDSVLDGNQADGMGGALSMQAETRLTLESCTLILNGAVLGGHVALVDSDVATADRTIFAFATAGGAVLDYYGGTMSLTCSDVWGNHGGNYTGPLAGQHGLYGNLNVDPELADPTADVPVYGPLTTSPVWTSSSCGWMGAVGAVSGYDAPVYGLTPDGRGQFLTLAEAFAAVPDGASIMLADGVYSGEGFDGLDPGTKNLVLASRSGDPEACVLSRPDSRDSWILIFAGAQSAASRVEGLGFTARVESPDYDDRGAVYLGSGTGVQFVDCRFDDVQCHWSSAVIMIQGTELAPSTAALTRCIVSAEPGSRVQLLHTIQWHMDLTDCQLLAGSGGPVRTLIYCADSPGGHMTRCLIDSADESFDWIVRYSGTGSGEVEFNNVQAVNCKGMVFDITNPGNAVFSSCQILSGDSTVIYDTDIEIRASAGTEQRVSIENCLLDGATSNGHHRSEAIRTNHVDVTISETTVRNYESTFAGCIWVENGSLAMIESTVEDCSASGSGGAVYVEDGELDMADCLLTRNSADSSGGAVMVSNSRITMSHCRLLGNEARGRGGAVAISSSSEDPAAACRLENVVMAGNRSRWGGGAVDLDGPALELTLQQCTVVANEVADDWLGEPAQLFVADGRLDLEHTIVSHSSTARAVHVGDEGDGTVHVYCSNIYGNAGGDWVGDIVHLFDDDENMSASPLFCDRSADIYSVHAASPCLPDNNACSTQIGARGLGCGDPAVGVDETMVPAVLSLDGAYPNPFNPSTVIRYALPLAANVRMSIHDVAGRCVRTLVHGEFQAAGAHAVSWDGRDGAGRGLGSGVYLVRLVADGQARQGRLTLLK